jgi:hypothetical protein
MSRSTGGSSAVRGKIIVVVMLLGALALLAYSLWFVGSRSAVDERFNMRREALAPDAPGASLLRELVGDYPRTSLDVGTLDSDAPDRHGSADYDVEGHTVTLDVQRIAVPGPGIEQLLADFAARADGDDAAGTVIRLHADAETPFGYGVYSAPTYIYYEFTWRNGDWVLRASTRDAGSEGLLRFVNNYNF